LKLGQYGIKGFLAGTEARPTGKKEVGRPSLAATFGGTGFPACAPHRQDAGANKNFSKQLLMVPWPTRKA